MSNRLGRARERLEEVERWKPQVAELATLASLAVRIEPELLRALRLQVAPYLDVGAEADLWFSSLVQARGADGMTLSAEVAEILREKLRRDARLPLAWRVIEECHRTISPALRLEEEVAWLALTDRPVEAIEKALAPALVSLIKEGRTGIAAWAARALPRLPSAARSTRVAWVLSLAASRSLAGRMILEDGAPVDLLDEDLRGVLPDLREIDLGIRRIGRVLEIGEGRGEGFSFIRVAETVPRIVEVRWEDEKGERRKILNLRPGSFAEEEVGWGTVHLRTINGVVYKLPAQENGRSERQAEPMYSVDPKSLASAGWCVIFAPDVGNEIKTALEPLLAHRRRQAGSLYKEYTYATGQTHEQFLEQHGADIGPVDPKLVPYYVMLVGSPETLPLDFQYELDVQYAVGRLYFELATDYEKYVEGVLAAERDESVRPPKRLAFFATSHENDRGTERTLNDLVRPLADALWKDYPQWPQKRLFGKEAVKRNLGPLFGGNERAALLMTVTHGMRFPPGDPLQQANQGALLCQEWRLPPEGEYRPILPEEYFSAVDVMEDADLRGMIAFLFAAFSAGTPALSDFDLDSGEPRIDNPQRLAPCTFLSSLPQRLLAHPRGGCLAVLGHIDRDFTLSFSWSVKSQPQIFLAVLGRLLDGFPIGAATEYINQRYAMLAVSTSRTYREWQMQGQISESQSRDFARRLKASHDARNFVVLGDPAVRLS